jgi:hypothetical protein
MNVHEHDAVCVGIRDANMRDQKIVMYARMEFACMCAQK